MPDRQADVRATEQCVGAAQPQRRHDAQPSDFAPVAQRGRSRAVVELTVGLVIALVMLRTWQVQWFVVTSGSMAPALLGQHARTVCGECGLDFAWGIEGPESLGRPAVCPNCGAIGPPVDDAAPTDGDRLPVVKAAFDFRLPRRWEIVAFRQPATATKVCVKRLVGLPGETIEIRDGDVFADGQIQRKSLPQQRALAVSVYDNDFRPAPTSTLPPRWRTDEDASPWQADGGGFVHPQRAAIDDNGNGDRADSPRIDWLTYHHQRRLPGVPDAAEESPVVDLCGYNQTRPVLTRYAVHDLLLSCRVKATGGGGVFFRARDGQDEFVAVLDPGRQLAQLHRGGQQVLTWHGDLSGLVAGALVEVSLVDRQFLLALDGQPLLVLPYDRNDGDGQPTTRPLAIGSQGTAIEVRNLRVLRDVYYVPVAAAGTPPGGDASKCLAADEFYLLGDNSPLSHDSRRPSPDAAVPAKLLLGKPLVIHQRSWMLAGKQ